MKIGRYEESLKDSDEMIQRAEALKDEFAEDYPIVGAKFYVQHANIKFIMDDYQKAIDVAKIGIDLCK